MVETARKFQPSFPVAVSLLTALMLSTAMVDVRAQTAPPAAPAAAPADTLLKAEELDQLVAPIALYPDTLLAEVLMASTYPLEVVQADRWAKTNKSLKGDQLKAAVDKQSWDESVKSLTATPSVLDMMSSKLDWTQKLGDAVLAQQPDVMDAVQRLRSKAQANKKLETTKQQKVTTRTESNKQVIVIEPAEPNTIYVPYYDPAVVYGAWAAPAYPPYYWPPPAGYYAGAAIATGLVFTAGFAVGAWAANNNFWGGGIGWGNNNINVNRNVNINNVNNWTHNSEHRHGVKYNNAQVQQKFAKGGGVDRGGAQQRMDFRGRDGQQVLRPDRPGGGDRPGLDRPGGGDRPGAGDRKPGGGDRPGAGDRRPGGGDRKGAAAGDRRPGGGDRPGAGNRPGGDRPGGGARPGGGGGGRDHAMGNIGPGRDAMAHANRGHASLGGGGGGPRPSMGGGGRGGGGFHGGGGRGGGRRSDAALKHDIVLIGHLDNGLGFYRFAYFDSDKAYVGVMAQEVQAVMPEAVVLGRDGYLRVHYEKLGATFQSYDKWLSSGARVPSAAAAGGTW